MNLFVATVGEVVIVYLVVFFQWIGVLKVASREKEIAPSGRQLLLTSLGLVFIAVGVLWALGGRMWEFVDGKWPFVWGITGAYTFLAAGGICMIVTPALGGGSLRSLNTFLMLTAGWTAFCVAEWWFNFFPLV